MSKNAKIFHRVESGPGKGMKTATAFSRHKDVQPSLDAHAEAVEGKARAILAGHHDSGAAYIEVVGGAGAKGANRKYVDVERVVVLSDERGFGAAMTIEFGMGPGVDDEGYFYPGTEAVAPLRRAAGLPWVRHRTGQAGRRQSNRISRRWKLGGV